MNALIPQLPTSLRLVPGPVAGENPEDQSWRDAWYTWRSSLLAYREAMALACDGNEARQLAEMAACAENPAYFLSAWGYVTEPRVRRRGTGTTPFIPYACQVDMIRWIDDLIAVDIEGATDDELLGDGLVSKSRDMGATWVFCAYILHGWLFKEPFGTLVVSRKEDLVDKKGMPAAVFWKLDFLYNNLPQWMKPSPTLKLERGEERLKLTMINPKNGNVVEGESTNQDTGRGGRYTLALVDEAATIPDLNLMLGTLINSTDHTFAVSTESLRKGYDFVNRRKALPKANVLELDWWLEPSHTQQWYENSKRRAPDPELFAQEVERNPYAGFGELVYPQAADIEPGDFPWEPGMPVYVGVDPGFADECAWQFLAHDTGTNRYRLFMTYLNNHQPPEFYASLLAGVEDDEYGVDYRDYGQFRTLDVLRFFADLPQPPTLMGDPYGNNRVTGKQDSFYDRLLAHYRKLRTKRLAAGSGVGVRMPLLLEWRNEKRTHQGRRASLMRLLPRIDFNQDRTVLHSIESLRAYRFEDHDRPRQTEQAKPYHTAASHPVTALEYFAVNNEAKVTAMERDLSPYNARTGQKLSA